MNKITGDKDKNYKEQNHWRQGQKSPSVTRNEITGDKDKSPSATMNKTTGDKDKGLTCHRQGEVTWAEWMLSLTRLDKLSPYSGYYTLYTVYTHTQCSMDWPAVVDMRQVIDVTNSAMTE